MNYRRWATAVEWSLVSSIVLIHGTIVAVGPFLGEEGLGALACNAFPFSQLALLLAWVLLGPGPAWVNWTAFPALAIACGLAWAWMWHDFGDLANAHQTRLLLATALYSGGLLIGLRLMGLAIRPLGGGNLQREKPAQFSIRSLIVFTTLVALAVGAIEALRPIITGETERLSPLARYVHDTVEDVFRPVTVRMLVLGVGVAGSAAAGLWTVLRPGAIWVRLVGTAIGLPLLAVYLADLYGNGISLRVNALPMTITGVSMLPLRLWNYRLSRHAVAPLAGTKPGPGVPRVDLNAQFAGSKFAPGYCARSESTS